MKREKRFTTLTPPIPQLPPEYEPKGYALAGEQLSPLAEEMLWCCARYYEHEIYWPKLLKTGNFYKCLKPELTPNQRKVAFPAGYVFLFKEMQTEQAKEKEEKAAYRKEHRKELAAEREALKDQCGYAVVDGERVAVAFQIEAPSIIITRGEDPRFGCWKYRVSESDITLNCVGGTLPAGFKGKSVSDPTSQWVLKYKQRCGLPSMDCYMELPKKVNLSGEIAVKNVTAKFDKTLDVIQSYNKIEKHILDGIKSKDPARKQAALCAWLIAETGIRVGNERDTDRFASTYGASTLHKEHFIFNE